jgi:hypothetical protein
MKVPQWLRQKRPGTEAVAAVKGSHDGGGGDDKGVLVVAVMMGSRWWQHALQVASLMVVRRR